MEILQRCGRVCPAQVAKADSSYSHIRLLNNEEGEIRWLKRGFY
jgi:hypothetical protein